MATGSLPLNHAPEQSLDALNLTTIRTLLVEAMQKAEALLGVNPAFPITIRIAAVIDELDKQISATHERGAR